MSVNPVLARAIQRRRALAKRLREQASAPLQGQMVGNHYVGANWGNLLGKVLQEGASIYQSRKAKSEQEAYDKQVKDAELDVVSAITGDKEVTGDILGKGLSLGGAYSQMVLDSLKKSGKEYSIVEVYDKEGNPQKSLFDKTPIGGSKAKQRDWGTATIYNEKGQAQLIAFDKNNPSIRMNLGEPKPRGSGSNLDTRVVERRNEDGTTSKVVINAQTAEVIGEIGARKPAEAAKQTVTKIYNEDGQEQYVVLDPAAPGGFRPIGGSKALPEQKVDTRLTTRRNADGTLSNVVIHAHSGEVIKEIGTPKPPDPSNPQVVTI